MLQVIDHVSQSSAGILKSEFVKVKEEAQFLSQKVIIETKSTSTRWEASFLHEEVLC